MSEFNSVTIIKKANVYFDGQVTSRTILLSDGSHKSLGIMSPGRYEFSTADREIMEILSGDLEVLLNEQQGWQVIQAGEQFEIAANSKFSVNVKALTDYCCSYIKE